MRTWAMVTAAVALCGCDFRTPLSREPAGEADRSVVGLWTRIENGREEKLLILPMGRREWLVSFPAGHADAMYGRAWPVRLGATTLGQIEWLGTARGQPPDGDRVFQLAAWSVKEGTLTVRLVDAESAGGRDAATPEELKRALETAAGGEGFHREPMIFRRAADAGI